VGTVVNTRPGYWDVDRCTWVGVEPMYVVPPARPAAHPSDRVPRGGATDPDEAAVPQQRDDGESVEVTSDQTAS
jgi:hypothetical protein